MAQQMMQHLQAQLEEQVVALSQRRQQLSAAARLPADDTRVQAQASVLDSLRYEAELLNDKLMKLRASRQDIETELFALKEKRIRLLDVINKLEDEEMSLVGEVNSIMHHKRALLKEVPFFEARARASAALGVVQAYLLASCQHLQHLHGGSALLAAPGWSGTAHVPRPAASWAASMPLAAGLASDSASDMAADSWTEACGVTGGLEQLQLEMERRGYVTLAGAGSYKHAPPASSGTSSSTAAASPGSSISDSLAPATRPGSRGEQAAVGWQANKELLHYNNSMGTSQSSGSFSGSPTSKLQRQSSDAKALEAAREAAGRERGRHTRQASLSNAAAMLSSPPPPPPPRRVRSHSMHSPVPLPMGGDTLPQLQLHSLAHAPAPPQLMLLRQQAAVAEQLQAQQLHAQQQQLLQQQHLLEQLMAGLQPPGTWLPDLTAALMPPPGDGGLRLARELAGSGAQVAAQPVRLFAPDAAQQVNSRRFANGPVP